MRAHGLIDAALRALDASIPVLSEEASAVPWSERSAWSRYWLVDPLDGTKEFLSRNGEFTVNIALIENHAPVLGVVYVPVQDTTYWGIPGQGAWRSAGADAAVPIQGQRPASIAGARGWQSP